MALDEISIFNKQWAAVVNKIDRPTDILGYPFIPLYSNLATRLRTTLEEPVEKYTKERMYLITVDCMSIEHQEIRDTAKSVFTMQ